MKKLLLVVLMGMMLAFAAACGSEGVQDEQTEQEGTEESTEGEVESKGTLRWGTNANWQPYAEAMAPELEALGYDVEVVVIDDTVSVDVSTMEGSTDFNIYQHKPYMDNFNAANDGDLVMIEPYLFTCVMGMTSSKYDAIEDIPDGALIGIAQDASNKDRGLRLLRDNGLLTLTEQDDNYSYTLLDIVENPHNFEFIEIELASMIKSLEDVDAACFQAIYLVNAGLGLDDVIAWSKDDYRYPCGIAVKEENADAAWMEDLISVCTSDKSREVGFDLWDKSMDPQF